MFLVLFFNCIIRFMVSKKKRNDLFYIIEGVNVQKKKKKEERDIILNEWRYNLASVKVNIMEV